MNVTSAQVQKILSGSYTFSQLGFSMLSTRLKGLYAKDPSYETLKECTGEINTFLQKYENTMAADLTIISKL